MESEKIIIHRNLEKLHREMGPHIAAAMLDKSIVEVMLNPDGSVWVDRLGQGMEYLCNLDEIAAQQMLGTIAHMLGKVINWQNPALDGELPGDGSRVQGEVYPICEKPSFNIRKKASAVYTLEQYVTQGRASGMDCDILRNAIKDRKNILVVGGTGTGKTTFTNAILNEISIINPQHRILILEETIELQCSAKNKVQMRACGNVTINELLRISLRKRPDRIVIGEVRGKEALEMLKAWNTGHPGGVSTVHANDARAGLIRIEQLIQEAAETPMRDLIGEAIDIVVFLKRDPRIGPKLEEIIEVKGVINGQYVFKDLRVLKSGELEYLADMSEERAL